jgi:hypothetical protein
LMIDHVSAWFLGDQTQRAGWYDSVELFRQPGIGVWAPVVAQVRSRIEMLCGV